MMKNLILLGTSHIAKESSKEVRRIIREEKPDIIAVELDRRRMYALLHKEKSRLSIQHVLRIGVKGFLFALIGRWLSVKLGKLVGVDPGSEMLTAIKLAKKHKLPVSLIDQEIDITLRKFSKTLTWKEKWQFIKDIFRGIFRKKELMEKYKHLDLRKVPGEDFINELIEELREKYPNIYNVLIEERNKVMVSRLQRIMNLHPEKKILAVVGAGHKNGMLELLKKEEQKVTYSFSFG